MDLQTDPVEQLLREGIAAAKARQPERARALLQRVIELDPTNARAWLWLSGVVKGLDEQVLCLENAQALDPDNATVGKALATLRTRQMQAWLDEGIAAARAGDRERARERLLWAVDRDEKNVTAWWWLSQVVDSPEDREVCLENVLALDPAHTEARESLAQVRREEPLEAPSNGEAIPPVEGPFSDVASISTAAVESYAGAAADDVTADDVTADAGIAPLPADMSSWAMFEDETCCPYCASPTDPDDHRCPVCGQGLWVRRRNIERPSASYWVVVALEVIFVVGGVLLPLILLTYVAIQLGVEEDILQLAPIYLGQADALPVTQEVLFGIVPRALFWLSLLPSVLSVLAVIGILSRWMPLYVAVMVIGGVRTVIGMGSLFLAATGGLGVVPVDAPFYHGPPEMFVTLARNGIIVSDLIVVVFSLISLILSMRITEHFAVEDRRRRLRVDLDVKGSEVGLWLRGREYAKQKMWASAALHLRQALALEERLESYLLLTLAYVNLARYDMAAQTLSDARRLSPGNPQVEEMALLLAEREGEE